MLITLALINGICIGLSRVWNARLGMQTGALWASLINHLVGFALLCCLLIGLDDIPWPEMGAVQPYLLLGGVFGALYVLLNTWVIGQIGLSRSLLLVLVGQMFTAILLDSYSRNINLTVPEYAAMALIVAGTITSFFKPGSGREQTD